MQEAGFREICESGAIKDGGTQHARSANAHTRNSRAISAGSCSLGVFRWEVVESDPARSPQREVEGFPS